MLLVGRPLPLILFALCIYVYSRSRFQSSLPPAPLPPEQHANSEATGPTKNEAIYPPITIEREAPSRSISTATTTLQTTSEVEEPTITTTIVLAVTETEVLEDLMEPTSPTIPRPAQTSTGIDVREYMDAILNWERPVSDDGHWPPYEEFIGKDYDPNRWEGFEHERGYYIRSGINHLDQQSIFTVTHFSYPDYNSDEWKSKWRGEYVTCKGAKGNRVSEESGDVPRAYKAVPNDMPKPMVGSADALGLEMGVCLDRVQRWGPYGYNPLQQSPVTHVDWKQVNWGELQNRCIDENKSRWAPSKQQLVAQTPDFRAGGKSIPTKSGWHEEIRQEEETTDQGKQEYHSRTAVLIRTWEGYDYSENDIIAIRAIVTELSLRSGGEYQVFLFVNIKDTSKPIYTDSKAYKEMLEKHVPQELRSIAVLWNEDMCKWMYPFITDWQVYWHQFMPVQWFSETHPQFDYVWNWEMDVRYIGNTYHFVTQVEDFARKQPRKYLWERNARIYIPSFHGTDYTAFVDNTNEIIANGASSGSLNPIWGPNPYSQAQKPLGPQPPWSLDSDNYTWGTDEQADLITLLPIWDPTNTDWTMRNKIWNFVPGVHPVFNDEHPTDDEHTHPLYANVPRRAFINTVVRMSRTLLRAMHEENLAGRTMQAEMWPSTVALHHGLKAVYAPQPVFSSQKFPPRYADVIFNSNGGVEGRWGQEWDSIYNQDRECNFRAWSWYYHAELPRVLYRRWMGWDARDELGNVGGEEWERGGEGPGGRMCLTPMLLHPIKRGDLEDT